MITWFMFPDLVLELKDNLFSLSHCVCSFLEEKLSRSIALKTTKKTKKTPKKIEKKKKEMIRRWNISKRLQTTEGNRVLSPIRRGHDGKRLLKDTRAPQKIQTEHLSCPSFFWLLNECCPVLFKREKKLLCLNCPSTGLCWFYTFLFLFFFFFVPWTLICKSLLKEA